MYGIPVSLSIRPPYGIMVHDLSPDPSEGIVGVKNIHLASWEAGIFYQDTSFDPDAEGFVENITIDASLAGILLDSSQGLVLNANTLGYDSPDMIGIALNSSSNNRLENNDITNALAGIGLFLSDDNSLAGNILTDNMMGGIGFTSSSYNTINTNTVTGLLIGGISLVNSKSNTLHDNILTNNGHGGLLLGTIHLASSPDNELSNNNLNNNGVGIFVDSGYLSLLLSEIGGEQNFSDYFTQSSSLNTFSHNTVNENDIGIVLFASDSNEFHENIINLNYGDALAIVNTSNTSFISNTLNENSGGIHLANSSGNRFNNNAFNNGNNFFVEEGYPSENSWNSTKTSGTNIIDGSYLGGNYWAQPDGQGFSQINPDTDGDGISNAEYTLAREMSTGYPLTNNSHSNIARCQLHRKRHFRHSTTLPCNSLIPQPVPRHRGTGISVMVLPQLSRIPPIIILLPVLTWSP